MTDIPIPMGIMVDCPMSIFNANVTQAMARHIMKGAMVSLK